MTSELEAPAPEASATPSKTPTRSEAGDTNDAWLATTPTAATGAPQNTEAPPDPSEVTRPRSVWWEVALCVATFGLYFSYYLYRLAKDLRIITNVPMTPFWWLLTPYFLLAQFFALPYLLRTLEKAESAKNLPLTWKHGSVAWMIGMWVVTLLINISDRIPDSDQWFVATFCFGVFLIALLHQRVNRIRTAHWRLLSNTSATRRFHVVEWLIAIMCLPISLLVLGAMLFYSEIFGGKQLESMQQGQQIQLEEHDFSIEIHGNGWSRVAVGSHSDGTALVELEGANTNAYYLVFEHDKDTNLNDISEYRTSEAAEEFFQSSCEENRTFIGSTTHIASTLSCTGKLLGNSIMVTSKSIETDTGVYELYGQFVAPKPTFDRYIEDYRNIEKGFRPQ